MADLVKLILAKPIQLTDQISTAAENVNSFKQECAEIKVKVQKLGLLLRQVARASNDLYERPTRRIVEDAEQVLVKALPLVLKCRRHGLMKRVFTIIPTASFRKLTSLLENSIGDVSWLLRVSTPANDRGDEYLGLPPIAANEPILGVIWEQIANLYNGALEDRSDAAASLVSLARDNDRYGKLIIEEGGIIPLLKLIKEGNVEGQENASKAIGLLGRNKETIEIMVKAGVCLVFAKLLKDGPMKAQAVAAWSVSVLASNYPKCQDLFAQHNMIRTLVGHLAFETVREHSKYTIVSKVSSIDDVVVANSPDTITSVMSIDDINNNNNNQPFQEEPITQNQEPIAQNQEPVNKTDQSINLAKSKGRLNRNSLSRLNNKNRELEDPATKIYMKSMAAKALGALAKGNSVICHSITESRALLCFSVLLEKGPEEVQYNSAMALMEITSVAEKDSDLRKLAFKPNSPACKAIIHQLLKIIENPDSNSNSVIIPCIKSIGNLARTFRSTESNMIIPLVNLLDKQDDEVSMESCKALTKFVRTDNYLHLEHSNAIVSSGGANLLVQLVNLGELRVQQSALILLCYIALYKPDCDEVGEAEVLGVLEWASKQPYLNQEEKMMEPTLLGDAIRKLELYQSRGTREF